MPKATTGIGAALRPKASELRPDGPPPPLRRRTTLLVKVAVSLLLAALVALWIDWRALWVAAGRVELAYVGASLLLVFAADALVAARLQVLMRPTGMAMSIMQLLRIGFVSRFYGMFLPAGVGLSVAKWVKVTRNRRGRLQFAVVLATEKVLLITVTLLFVGVPLLLTRDPRIRGVQTGLLVLAAVLVPSVSLFYGAVFSRRGSERLQLWLTRAADRTGPRARRLAGKLRGATTLAGRWRLALAALLLSLPIEMLIVGRIGLLFVAVGADLPVTALLWVAALVFLIQTLPISFAGIGVRESAFAYAFHLYALPHEGGVLVGLLFFAQLALLAVVGGVLEVTERRRPEAS